MVRTEPNLSRRDYDCIESVQALSSDGWSARVKDVAGRMELTPPTAVEFLTKQVDNGLVEKGPSGYRLTGEGARCYDEAIRTHRLLETLLARNGLSLEQACKISTTIGGAIAETDLERLCENLSHPDTCPHGRPIPGGPRHG